MNLSSLPDLRAEENPQGPCLADDDGEFDNEQFAETVRRAAAALAAQGVSAGDVVAVMLPNISALVVALFASWHVGAAVTPVNPSLVAAEAAYQVADANAKVLVVDKPLDFEVSAPVELTARG